MPLFPPALFSATRLPALNSVALQSMHRCGNADLQCCADYIFFLQRNDLYFCHNLLCMANLSHDVLYWLSHLFSNTPPFVCLLFFLPLLDLCVSLPLGQCELCLNKRETHTHRACRVLFTNTEAYLSSSAIFTSALSCSDSRRGKTQPYKTCFIPAELATCLIQ